MKFSILAVTIASSVYAQTLEQQQEIANSFMDGFNNAFNAGMQENAAEAVNNPGAVEDQLELANNIGNTEDVLEIADIATDIATDIPSDIATDISTIVEEAAKELSETSGTGEMTFGLLVGLGVLIAN